MSSLKTDEPDSASRLTTTGHDTTQSNDIDSPETSQLIKRIIDRIHREQVEYIGIYKPGELGRETWRAVIPCTAGRGTGKKRGRGRGKGGQWESVIIPEEGREQIDCLFDNLRNQVKADIHTFSKQETSTSLVGIRHIVNPHCNQDEGMRIVWSKSQGEMRDWSRRDKMMREGKTVRAISEVDGQGGGEIPIPIPIPLPLLVPVPVSMVTAEWDNIGWTRLV